MTNLPVGMVSNNISCSMNSSHQSPARRYYASSPSRRPHDSCSDVSYSDRPLLGSSLQSTPCRRYYDNFYYYYYYYDSNNGVRHQRVLNPRLSMMMMMTTTTTPSAATAPVVTITQSTPCRRHYDTIPTEAQWNGRDGSRPVIHRIKTTATTTTASGTGTTTAPPQTTDNDDKNETSSSSYVGRGGAKRPRSQAQMVDVMSRILFPCMFLIFNIVYWPWYLFFSSP